MKNIKTLALAGLALMMAVPAIAQKKIKTYGYLYCHMSDRGEWTAYALSRDGLNYHDLKEGQSVYDCSKINGIEGGSRDAFIARTPNNKGFVMVTTDMCVARKTDKARAWFNYGMNLLKSDDLINWTSVTFDFRKGPSIFCDPESPDFYKDYATIDRVWAPQVFWDKDYVWPNGDKGGYFCYYSLLNSSVPGDYDRIFYSYIDKTFTKMTKPRVLVDWGYATIDADINFVEADGKFHMMVKKEGGKPGIFTSTADKLTGPWSLPDDDDYVDFEGKKKCEGPSAFQIEGEEGWRVAYIEYSSKPRHYRICKADKFLRNFSDPQDITGVTGPQHGSFLRLTKKEYNRLEKWGNPKKK